jgi:aspartate/methionine/tyrosine aminotransferase
MLTVADINQNVVRAQYAVRGELVLKAQDMKGDLSSYPFDKVLECNIGNPQAVEQMPLSFGREVLSLLLNPALLAKPAVSQLFKADAIARAKEYLAAVPQGLGAYSESQGVAIVRQQVADFISARDGVPGRKEDIFLTDGASKGVGFLLQLVLRAGEEDGLLVPIPQYPLYSATLALQGAHMLGYELDEGANWALDMGGMERAVADAKARGVSPRALVVINPGNPTGNCLPLENMQECVRFCAAHGLVLMADEVYQENIYDNNLPFISFKKVMPIIGRLPSGGGRLL